MEALKNKEDAALAVKEHAHLTAELGILVAARDKASLAVLEKHNPGILAKSGAIAGLELQLKAWAEKNPEVFGDERSVEFSHGFLKWRTGPRKLVLLARWTWAKALEKLLEFPPTSQWRELIRFVPEINKRKILECTKTGGNFAEPMLREVGMRVVREDSFTVEPKPDMVARDCDLMP